MNEISEPVFVPRQLSLPTVQKVSLSNFDLYSIELNPSVEIASPVFCLIGANGLGKSTFLNTLNFGITGAVPDPRRRFKSAQDYYRNAARIDRSDDYFNGRISESFRPLASVTVEMRWPSATVTLTREVFGGAVTQIDMVDLATGAVSSTDVEDSDGGDLAGRYQQLVVGLTGLEDFSQFVFLMHFVLTFDEGRHLLMWDDAALTNALYLAFGGDPAAAKAADKLQLDMDRESSRGRNVRFSARHVAERIKQLAELLNRTDEEDDHTSKEQLQAQHNALLDRQIEAEERARRKQAELQDLDLKWADLSASLTESQLEYRRLFSNRLKGTSSVEHHPIVRASISEDRCALCGTNHIGVLIQQHIQNASCPLCESALSPAVQDSDAIAALRRLDGNIIRIRADLTSTLDARARIADELFAAHASEQAASDELAAFEMEHAITLSMHTPQFGFSAVHKEMERLEEERRAFLQQSEQHYKRRDEIRAQLRVHEKALRIQYETGSERFVPRFRELAEAFIGLPIDVELEHRKGANVSGFGLRMRMDDQVRAQPESVSESQRFFIDIALRMALAEFMTQNVASLLIDTPEGSLDIAYEARAGLMFSKFVEEGNRILMTANLRSSELVLRLAHLQKRAGMQIARMTEWTDLSEVQQSEEQLFVDAYQNIDQALG